MLGNILSFMITTLTFYELSYLDLVLLLNARQQTQLHDYNSHLQEIVALLDLDSDVQACHVSRVANSAAGRLAKSGARSMGNLNVSIALC